MWRGFVLCIWLVRSRVGPIRAHDRHDHPVRWARGGVAVSSAAPSVTFGMREEVFARPDVAQVIAHLVSAFTDAVTAVFGDECRDEVLVELVGQPTSRSGLGGKVISNGTTAH